MVANCRYKLLQKGFRQETGCLSPWEGLLVQLVTLEDFMTLPGLDRMARMLHYRL